MAHTLCFAPTPHGGWLQLPVLAAFFLLLDRTTRRGEAGLLGIAFGVGNFVTGLYWLFISMHLYGGMASPLAAAAVLLFSLYLSVYPGLACASWRACTSNWPLSSPPNRQLWPPRHANHVANPLDAPADSRPPHQGTLCAIFGAILFGASWTIGEWLRGTMFTGFPWLSLGYAQVDGPMAGFAAWIGVYGVSFVTAMVAALLTICIGSLSKHRNIQALCASVVVVVLAGAGILLPDWRFTRATQPPLSVRLLQGAVPQDIKFEQSGVDHAVALYQRLITEKPADLIITPETALPFPIDYTPAAFAQATRAFADTTGSTILLGALGNIEQNGVRNYTNASFALVPGQRVLYRYDKHHLVPFGEFVPWGFRWAVDLMHIPLGDLARGALGQPPLLVKGERFAINICYEDLFGEEIASTLRRQTNPATVLVNSSNLAWFGDTIALDQHLQIARMRALEMQRPVLNSTNTGVSSAIDPWGRVTARLPTERAGALDTSVQGMSGLTPYIRFGNIPILCVALLLLVGARMRKFARRR
jgi:apolipoprotein N-acyltransferase